MYRRDIIGLGNDFWNLYFKYTHSELTWNDKIKNRMKVFYEVISSHLEYG